MFELGGKTIIVTGASSGLGNHFAQVLAAQGAYVIVGARRLERCNELVAVIESSGGQAAARVLDVSDRDRIDAIYDEFEIDVLINNAGINAGADLVNTSDEDWDQVLAVDLTSVAMMSRGACKQWLASKRSGVIVNIASILGLRVGRNMIAYNTAKAAVIQLTKSMATDYGRYGIRSNALCPGYFPSELTQDYLESEASAAQLKRVSLGRAGKLRELDAPLLLLASDAGSYMNGSVLAVDGGHLVSPL